LERMSDRRGKFNRRSEKLNKKILGRKQCKRGMRGKHYPWWTGNKGNKQAGGGGRGVLLHWEVSGAGDEQKAIQRPSFPKRTTMRKKEARR